MSARTTGPKSAARLQMGSAPGMATHALAIEARTHLLYSFEKMALRDTARTTPGTHAFARGLYDFLYGPGAVEPQIRPLVLSDCVLAEEAVPGAHVAHRHHFRIPRTKRTHLRETQSDPS
jgi:hypothetical protein